MPNTFGHIAVQGPLSRIFFRDADPRWIYLGCILPDVPWILQRIVVRVAPTAFDRYDVRLAAVVLASLFASFVLAAACAMLAERRGRTFALLAFGSTVHLLLDACQIKWANGVHLFAPFLWEPLRFDLFWPESLATLILTAGGVIAFVLLTTRAREREPLRATRGRVTLAIALLAAYATLPALFMPAAEKADNHFVRTLRHPDVRAGRPVEFDRASFHATDRGVVLETFTGERLFVTGPRPDPPALVSLRGMFVDARTVHVRDAHVHAGRTRDWMSVLGLSAVAVAWLLPAPGARRRVIG